MPPLAMNELFTSVISSSPRLLLVSIEEPVYAVLMAVARQPQELTGVRASCHHHYLGDPGAHQRLDRVGDHRPVVYREQVLVGDPGQRVQPAPGPASQDYALHRPVLAISCW